MRIHYGILFLVFVILIRNVYADDTEFGGTGSSPMPIKSNEIKMANEHVNIVGHQIDKENVQGEWKVSCDFTFKNMTDKSITMDMGFPFPIFEEDENISAPQGKKPQKGGPLIYNFMVKIDGKEVPASKQTIASNSEKGIYYNNAYIWKVHFLPNQILKIHHDYTTGVTFNVMGYTLVKYVLLTGGLWHGGVIDNAQIDLIPNSPTRLCSELVKNANEYLKPKPQGLKIMGDGMDRHYVWNLNNFRPKEDLDVCLQTGKNYVRYQFIYPLLYRNGDNTIDLNKMNQKELRILLNTIYAQYGKRFESPELQEYFNKQWWYVPNNKFNDDRLTNEDRQAIEIIRKAEIKRSD